MADIELVIKIPEYRYNRCKANLDTLDMYETLADAVRKGKVLSKGHGNIIDVNSIKEISLSNITYHMVWQPRNDTELKCRIEAPILVKSDAKSEIIVRTESEE